MRFFLLGRISITVRDGEALLEDCELAFGREICPGMGIPPWFGMLVPGPRPIWGRFIVKKRGLLEELVRTRPCERGKQGIESREREGEKRGLGRKGGNGGERVCARKRQRVDVLQLLWLESSYE